MPGDQCYDPPATTFHYQVEKHQARTWVNNATVQTDWHRPSRYEVCWAVFLCVAGWLGAILLGPNDNHLTLNILASCWPVGEIAQNSPLLLFPWLFCSCWIVKQKAAAGCKLKISTWLDSLQSHCKLSSSIALFSQFEVFCVRRGNLMNWTNFSFVWPRIPRFPVVTFWKIWQRRLVILYLLQCHLSSF